MHLTRNRLEYDFHLKLYAVHSGNGKLHCVPAHPSCSTTAHTARCSAPSHCSSALRLLSALLMNLSSSQIRPNPDVSVQGCPAQAEQTPVCETLRWQLYQVLSSDKTQRHWLQINSCSECCPSSQTCARVLLEWTKGPLHSHRFRSSVLRGPELP